MRGMKLALVAAVAATAGVSAIASPPPLQESYSFSLEPTKTDFSSLAVIPSVPKFNLPGTKLTKVTLNFTASIDTTLTVENSTGSQSSPTHVYGLFTNCDVTLDPNLAGAAPADASLLVGEGKLSGHSTVYDVYSGSPFSKGYSDSAGSGDVVYTSSSVLNEFTGSGNLSLSATGQANTMENWGGGNAIFGQTTFASLTGTVTYDYVSVPEATTLVLGGLAVMPLALHRRRARKVA